MNKAASIRMYSTTGQFVTNKKRSELKPALRSLHVSRPGHKYRSLSLLNASFLSSGLSVPSLYATRRITRRTNIICRSSSQTKKAFLVLDYGTQSFVNPTVKSYKSTQQQFVCKISLFSKILCFLIFVFCYSLADKLHHKFGA